MHAKMKLHAWPRLAVATILIGSLDLAFAWAFWAPRGVTLGKILLSIAAGWFGSVEAQRMQTLGAGVGAMSHYAIVLVFIIVYREMGKRNGFLLRKWMACGAAYGIALYSTMQFVVLPLSNAAPTGFSNRVWVASSIVMHVLVGVMCAFTARKSVP